MIRLISNWTEWSTIQRVIRLVISNRTSAARSSDFEGTRVITPWIVLHLVQFGIKNCKFYSSNMVYLIHSDPGEFTVKDSFSEDLYDMELIASLQRARSRPLLQVCLLG